MIKKGDLVRHLCLYGWTEVALADEADGFVLLPSGRCLAVMLERVVVR